MEQFDFSTISVTVSQSDLKAEPGVQYLDFEGARIAFDFQPSTVQCNKLLVLINGFQRNYLDFRAFRKKIHSLNPSLATLALDNRYCGQTIVTEKAQELTVFRMAKDVAALAAFYCRSLGLNAFSALGISMGGMIAQTLAAHCPQVDALILVSTTAGGQSRVWPQGKSHSSVMQFKDYYVSLDSTKNYMKNYFGERFLKNSPLLFEMMCKTLVKNREKVGDSVLDAAQMQLKAASNFDGESLLSKIFTKTLVISGDADAVVPLANSYYLKDHIKNSSLIVYKDVGHLILIEEPDLFVSDICTFLS